MIQKLVHNILTNYSYLQLYLLTVLYFCFLYFALGPLFLWVCRWLEKKGWLHRIQPGEATSKQIAYEIRHSVQSILIFGFSVIPIVYLIREGILILLPDTLWNTLAGLSILIVWNEIHFFLIHRLMHWPFFYRHIHQVHHRSKIPTVFSVFSFHGLEAFLLSTVECTLAVFVPFSAAAIFLFPLVSILLNYAGHCNYRFGSGQGAPWQVFGTRHSMHHYKNTSQYGFASHLLDKLFPSSKKNKNTPHA